MGATFCAVIKDNPITAVAIDNWKESIQPATNNIDKLPENTVHTFIENVKKYKGNSQIKIYDADLFEVDLTEWYGKIRMFFYDGPHDKVAVLNAIKYFYNCLTEESIVIFDDANWAGVVYVAK